MMSLIPFVASIKLVERLNPKVDTSQARSRILKFAESIPENSVSAAFRRVIIEDLRRQISENTSEANSNE